MTGLVELSFLRTSVSNLAPLKEMKKLREIVFQHTQVASLEPLNGISTLAIVYCEDTKVSEDNIEKFMDANPNCEVY